ncbi:RNA polymerase sigma factor [Frankia sp. AiPa1]|uniref:RNA polymerase sigma factor n=1 Tax=Frankia sp. AiPa1 TaxID=573492 RepID=UPI0035A8FF05
MPRPPDTARSPDSTAAYPSWEEIYRDNVDRVYRMMFAKVGNRADAEDLTAEVFTTALRPLRVSASVGEVRAYLNAVARTALAAHWRRTLGVPVTTLDAEQMEAAIAESGRAEDLGGPGSTDGHPDDVNRGSGARGGLPADGTGAESRHRRRGEHSGHGPLADATAAGQAGPVGSSAAQAEEILAALSPRYQQILRLRFLESRTIREAASELGVSVANAKVLQHRALRKAAQISQTAEPARTTAAAQASATARAARASRGGKA